MATKQQQQFNLWVSSNYEYLKQRVMLQLYWNEDVFHDTYLDLYLHLADLSAEAYEHEFLTTYKRLEYERFNNEYSYVQPDELFFAFLTQEPADEQQEHLEWRERRLDVASKAFLFVKSSPVIKKRDRQIFDLRFMSGFSFSELAETLAIGEKTARESIKQTIQYLRGFITLPNTLFSAHYQPIKKRKENELCVW